MIKDMYIFKNAIVSITRNKGRNFLIGIIIVVISCAAAISLAIRNSSEKLIDSYKSQYETTATIGINRESMRGEMKMDRDASEEDRESRKENMQDIFNSASDISVEDIEEYGDSKYVKDYYYQIGVGVNSDDIDKVSQSSNDDEDSGNGDMPERGPGGQENFQNMSSSDFTLVGYSSVSGMEEFISGKYKITDGEISDDMESANCVINSELASLNGIEVEDKIVVVDSDSEDNTMELTVTGIYEEASDTDSAMGMFTSSANMIITNTTTVNKLASGNEDIKKTVTPTFVLTSSEVVDKFSEELSDKGLSEYLTVNTNLDQVEGATSTISNTKTFATTFLVITLIIGGVVLFVINMINIRERKYEIGVLRTIGMKKSLLTMQFIVELLVVAVISLLIGAGLGATMSVSVSNNLLESEISKASEEKNDISENFGGGRGTEMFDKVNGVAEVQAFDSIDAVVDIKVLGQLFVLGIILTLISSSASMISIQRFSPLTILKERS